MALHLIVTIEAQSPLFSGTTADPTTPTRHSSTLNIVRPQCVVVLSLRSVSVREGIGTEVTGIEAAQMCEFNLGKPQSLSILQCAWNIQLVMGRDVRLARDYEQQRYFHRDNASKEGMQMTASCFA